MAVHIPKLGIVAELQGAELILFAQHTPEFRALLDVDIFGRGVLDGEILEPWQILHCEVLHGAAIHLKVSQVGAVLHVEGVEVMGEFIVAVDVDALDVLVTCEVEILDR